MFKLVLFGTVAVLIQSISSQCIGNFNNPGRFGGSYSGSFAPYPGKPVPSASTGGSFAVTSASPVSPTGVSVLAENLAIEGPLSVGGNLPFLGTVGIEGAMPNAGSGSVSYGCGTGNVGIVGESSMIGPYSAAGPAIGGLVGSTVGPSAIGSFPIAPIAPISNTLSPGLPGSFGSLNSPMPGSLGLSRSLGSNPGSFLGSSLGSGFGFNGLRR